MAESASRPPMVIHYVVVGGGCELTEPLPRAEAETALKRISPASWQFYGCGVHLEQRWAASPNKEATDEAC